MNDIYLSKVGYLLIGKDYRSLRVPIRCFVDEEIVLKYLEDYEKTNKLVVKDCGVEYKINYEIMPIPLIEKFEFEEVE